MIGSRSLAFTLQDASAGRSITLICPPDFRSAATVVVVEDYDASIE